MAAKNTNKFFRKIVGQDRSLNQVQTNVEQAIAEVIKNPLLDGRLLTDIALSATANRIEHKLGRKPNGYIVVKRNANVQVYDTLASEGSPDLFLPLTASGTVTVSLWIF